jgi:hypothetical protein
MVSWNDHEKIDRTKNRIVRSSLIYRIKRFFRPELLLSMILYDNTNAERSQHAEDARFSIL